MLQAGPCEQQLYRLSRLFNGLLPHLVGGDGVDPSSPVYKTGALAGRRTSNMVQATGTAPVVSYFQSVAQTIGLDLHGL